MQAVAGTHAVLLGMDLADPAGCLGFAIHREDSTEQECQWLRGMKTFPSVVPEPAPGSDWSTRYHPVQGFQWGDYSAKPGHDYTYTVHALGPPVASPALLASVRLRVRTELEDDGVHGIWFNRGVAGSQAFARRFAGWVPGDVPDEAHPAMVWLSRGLGEAFLDVCAQADGPGWSLHGAFYELTWARALTAFAAARDRGAEVRLVVHGRDRDPAPEPGLGAPSGTPTPQPRDDDRTAAAARRAVTAAGLDDVVTWRESANRSALHHHKFLVLARDGVPRAVWTGSTNLTLGAVYGHSNVGHLVHDPAVAATFEREWQRLVAGDTTQQLRADHAADLPVTSGPAAAGTTVVMSPRPTLEALEWYAALVDAARSSAHLTGAFGLHQVFRDLLAQDRDVVRTVLLDKVPARDARIPLTDPDVRLSTGSHLTGPELEQWAAERLTGFNGHVRYIHTKVVLVDPLGLTPTVLTGSANYSTASTTGNEENTLVIHAGRDAASRRAVRRVADIYLTEYHRLFMHHVFRALAGRVAVNTGEPEWTGHLDETDGWWRRYYAPGSWRERQRHLFAGT